MRDRLKVRFLTVIWGTRYIEEFAQISLPSYLAAGNLPFLAAETDLEIVVMTSTESRGKFEEGDYLDKLKALCPVRYILIDDLITDGNYGVTLTLAYARGIRDVGAEQTNTHFVFMNSDFVLADGSLRTLVAKLQEGHHAVMAPSLRAWSEAVVPALIDAVDRADRTLTMAPRPMVQLAFDNLHATVIGKTITQDFITCATHNQLYWQVDKHTLLGRYHLIFMLAIKPEVPMGLVNSYCDYGFVAELVPSGDFTIIDDSDGFFMLEMQSAEQEKSYLRSGRTPPEKIAEELSSWTTREHRRFAEVDIVFRSGDLPASLPQVRAEAARFISNLHQQMTPPNDHVDHFYWTSGVQAWGSMKFPGEAVVLPAEIAVAKTCGKRQAKPPKTASRRRVKDRTAGLRGSLAESYIRLLGLARRRVGSIPDVPIWHHLWLDSRLILNWIGSIAGGEHRKNALVCHDASPLRLTLQKHLPIEVLLNLQDLASGVATDDVPAGRTLDNIFVHIRRAEVLRLKKVLEWADKNIKPGGTVAIYIEHENSDQDQSNFSLELAQYTQYLLPSNWMGLELKASFVGGTTKRQLRLSTRWLFRFLRPFSLERVLYLVVAAGPWMVLAARTAWNNFRLRNLSSDCPDYCSSALLSLKNSPMDISVTASPSEGKRTAAPR